MDLKSKQQGSALQVWQYEDMWVHFSSTMQVGRNPMMVSPLQCKRQPPASPAHKTWRAGSKYLIQVSSDGSLDLSYRWIFFLIWFQGFENLCFQRQDCWKYWWGFGVGTVFRGLRTSLASSAILKSWTMSKSTQQPRHLADSVMLKFTVIMLLSSVAEIILLGLSNFHSDTACFSICQICACAVYWLGKLAFHIQPRGVMKCIWMMASQMSNHVLHIASKIPNFSWTMLACCLAYLLVFPHCYCRSLKCKSDPKQETWRTPYSIFPLAHNTHVFEVWALTKIGHTMHWTKTRLTECAKHLVYIWQITPDIFRQVAICHLGN